MKWRIIEEGDDVGVVEDTGDRYLFEYNGQWKALQNTLDAINGMEDMDTGYADGGVVTERLVEADSGTKAAQAVSTLIGWPGVRADKQDGGDDPEETKAWVPYEGPRGGTGWQETGTERVVYDDEPPGETIEPKPVSEDDPLQTGEAVVINYPEGDPHDRVPAIVAQEDNGRVRIHELGGNRNSWSASSAGFDEDHPLSMESLGLPEGGADDPETMDIEDADDAAYVLDELEPDEGSERLLEAVESGGLSVDDAYEAADQSDAWTPRVLGNEAFYNHGHGESEHGTVSLNSVAERADTQELRSAFSDEVGEWPANYVSGIAHGWEGRMYQDPSTAPLIQHAAEITGNETMPEYRSGDRALHEEADEDKREAVEALHRFNTERFREAFGDTVTLFRGLSDDPHQGTPSEGTGVASAIVEAKRADEDTEIDHRPAESWSLNPDAAKLYARIGYGDGAVVKREVPVEDILMSSSVVGPRRTEEDTVVAHDGPATYDPDDVYAIPEDDDEAVDEAHFKMMIEAAMGARR